MKNRVAAILWERNHSAFRQRAPNVRKINSFRQVAQVPLKTSVLQDLIRNEDLSVRRNGNQSRG